MEEALVQRREAALAADDVEELIDVGIEFADRELFVDAQSCFQRASDLGAPGGAFNLGNVLASQECWAAAAAAFELAIDRGDDDGWVPLGQVLHELGDLAREMRAYRTAEARGHSEGALWLAWALREQGEPESAMAASHRSADAGNATAVGVTACWQWNLTLDPALEPALRAGAEHYPGARADLADLVGSTGR